MSDQNENTDAQNQRKRKERSDKNKRRKHPNSSYNAGQIDLSAQMQLLAEASLTEVN